MNLSNKNMNDKLVEIYQQLGGVEDVKGLSNFAILNKIAILKGGSGNNTNSFEALKEILNNM